MTNKTYSKEELFLRELAQVCKKYITGLHEDKHLGIITVDIDNLDVVGIHILPMVNTADLVTKRL